MSRILIFGGSGFVGRHLINELSLSGHDLTVADIVLSKDHGTAKFISCDIRKVIDISEPFDIVINLAAVHRTPGHEPWEYYETNVLGTINIVRWCNVRGINKIVFVSSISIYGAGGDQKTEMTKPSPNSDYGRSKLMAEQIYLHWQSDEMSQIRQLTICRPAVIFGAGENGNFTRLAKVLRKGIFIYPGGKDVIKASGYVKDLCKSINFSLSLSQTVFVYNFAFPDKHNIGEIVKALSQYFNLRFQFSVAKTRLLKSLLGFIARHSEIGSRANKLAQSTDVAPTELKRLGFHWDYNLSSALQDWEKESNFDLEKRFEN